MPRKRSFKKIKAKLEHRHKEVLDALSTGLAESKSAGMYRTMDSPEMASSCASAHIVFHFVEMESEELDQIEDALDRVEDGTYGVCEGCGKGIGQARLEAMPSATLCIDCKAADEAGELHMVRPVAMDWERVEAFERDKAQEMAVALDRGEKIT